MRLYGYRSKYVTAGLDCGLGCTPALSVTTASLGLKVLLYIMSVRVLCSFYISYAVICDINDADDDDKETFVAQKLIHQTLIPILTLTLLLNSTR